MVTHVDITAAGQAHNPDQSKELLRLPQSCTFTTYITSDPRAAIIQTSNELYMIFEL